MEEHIKKSRIFLLMLQMQLGMETYFTDFTEYSELKETYKDHRVQVLSEWRIQFSFKKQEKVLKEQEDNSLFNLIKNLKGKL